MIGPAAVVVEILRINNCYTWVSMSPAAVSGIVLSMGVGGYQ